MTIESEIPIRSYWYVKSIDLHQQGIFREMKLFIFNGPEEFFFEVLNQIEFLPFWEYQLGEIVEYLRFCIQF